MFRALLAYPQEALHKRHLVYCLRMSVVCTKFEVELVSTLILVQLTDILRTQYTKCCFVSPPEDEQVMLETFTGP
jgi:hypothetical protein